MVAGRNFDDRTEATEGDKVLINETAAKIFGWSDPIGKRIKGYGGDQVVTVIGVMKDFHYKSLDQPIGPLIHWYGGKSKLGSNSAISVRYDPRYKSEIATKLTTLFKQLPSKKGFSYRLMGDMVKDQYILIDGILKVTNYVAFLILCIASMGLLGLSMMFALQRTKEVGIRKVLGASVAGIVLLLSKGYLKLVAIAVVIAVPIAWWIMEKWLEDYAYRIEIQWWMFLLTGLITVMIALFTVGWHALRTAVINPVKSLREE